MKDITIRITGKQCFDGKEEDHMEFITDGKLYERGGYTYVTYDESEVSGLEGCKTTLRMKGETVKMKRTDDDGYGTELYFEPGKRFSSTYETPFGIMGLEVLTKSVINSLDTELVKGRIDIEYDVSLGGIAEGKNKLTIDFM